MSEYYEPRFRTTDLSFILLASQKSLFGISVNIFNVSIDLLKQNHLK